MAKERFERTKPHINVGTIGHLDHGKSTLVAAILTCQNEQGLAAPPHSYNSLRKTLDGADNAPSVDISHIEYVSNNRHYGHIDCPGHEKYVSNLIKGVAQIDSAILVVSAVEGVMPQTREHLILACQHGLKQVVVFLNKADLVDAGVITQRETEIRKLLGEYKFSDDTPIVSGSALQALAGQDNATHSIAELIATMDQYIAIPERYIDRSFLMSIERTYSTREGATVAIGCIERGTIHPGDKIEIAGLGATQTTTCLEVEMFGKTLDEGQSGDSVGILLEGVGKNDVKQGQVLAKPGSAILHSSGTAQIQMLKAEEGGRSNPIFQGFKPSFHFSTAKVTGTITPGKEEEMVMPGDTQTIDFTLDRPVVINQWQHFTMRRDSTIALGRVVTITE